MKNLTRLGWVVLLLVVFAPLTQAQITPVRVRVEKHQKTQNVRSEDQHGHYMYRTVWYSAEVFSMNASLLPDVVVKWALYGRQIHTSKDDLAALFVVEGEKKCSLIHGQTYELETDQIDLMACPMSGGKGEVLGYAFQVLVDDKVVASSVAPENTLKKIEAIKAAREKPNPNRF